MLFAAILLLIAGTLNVIYGLAELNDSDFFASESIYVFASADTWGAVTVGLGVVEVLAAASLLMGGAFGRVFAMFAASLTAIGAVLSIGGAHPYWSIGIFALSIIILHGLAVYGEPQRAT